MSNFIIRFQTTQIQLSKFILLVLFLFIFNSYGLVRETEVQVGQFLELNSEAEVWVVCDHQFDCGNNIQSGSLTQVVSIQKSKLQIRFADSSQAYSKPTVDGFEAFRFTDATEFESLDEVEDVDIFAVKQDPSRVQLDQEILDCQQGQGIVFERLKMGCSESASKDILKQRNIAFSNLPGDKILLRNYVLHGKPIEVYLKFNKEHKLYRIEYQFPAKNYRTFQKVNIPEVKWLSEVFTQYQGTTVKVNTVLSSDVKRDQFTAYQTWSKPDYKIETGFQKQYSDIFTMGYIEFTGTETEQKRQAVQEAEAAKLKIKATQDSLELAEKKRREALSQGVVEITDEEKEMGF